MKPWNWMRGVAAAVATVVCLSTPTEAGVKRAVIVGVDDYQKEAKLPNLRFAGADAVRMEKVLLDSGYSPEHVRVLRSGTADPSRLPTRENIRQAVRELLASNAVDPSDAVMLVFGGHGFNEHGASLLCPSDYAANASDTAIRVAEIAELLADSPAAEKYVVIDACRNESIAEDAREFNLVTGLKNVRLQQQGGQGIAFFSSCLAGEQSFEDASLGSPNGDAGGGVFMHYFAQGLTGYADYEAGNGDGKVSPAEAIDYAAQKTSGHVQRRFDARQTPWADSHSTAQLVISQPNPNQLEMIKEKVKNHTQGKELEARLESLKPISRKQAEARFDVALGTLVQGDRQATIRYASQAIEMDESYYLARRMRSVMYQIEGNSSPAQAADFYRKAIADMTAVGSRLRIPLAHSIPLQNGHKTIPLTTGDVLLVEETQVYGNRVWLKVTGVSSRNPETGLPTAPRDEVGFIELAAVANSETSKAQLLDLNRAQKPTRSEVNAQQASRLQANQNINISRPVPDAARIERVQTGLGIAAGVTSQIPGASRASPWLGMASGIVGRFGR